MEKVLSQDDRIRRAEEIYARRKDLRDRTKKATVSVNNESKAEKKVKKVTLQIIICILIYCIFYLINTTSYSFSDEAISKTTEIISYDVDFAQIYDNVVGAVNNYIYSEEVEEIESIEEEETEESTSDEEVLDETTDQEEVSVVEESETDRIKREYSFVTPLSRTALFRQNLGQEILYLALYQHIIKVLI